MIYLSKSKVAVPHLIARLCSSNLRKPLSKFHNVATYTLHFFFNLDIPSSLKSMSINASKLIEVIETLQSIAQLKVKLKLVVQGLPIKFAGGAKGLTSKPRTKEPRSFRTLLKVAPLTFVLRDL